MVFVTGGTGLVGSHIICQLLSDGYKVRALCRSTSDKAWFYKTAKWLLSTEYTQAITKLEWFEGDVTDVVSLIDGVAGCTQVYHAAAVVSFAKSNEEILRNININGTANVVNACLGTSPHIDLCFISSTASIGGVEKKLLDETAGYNNDQANSYYSVTKYLAELEVIRGREEGLNASIINPSIVLGYGNWNQGSAKIIKNGKVGFPFYTDGSNAFVDARDVAKASTLLMENKCFEGRYLCAAWNRKFVDLFKKLATEFDSKPPRIHVIKWMAEVAWRLAAVLRFFTGTGIITKESASAGMKSRSYSSERLERAVSFNFRDFDQALSEICEAYKSE
ncbi:MAG: dihydroflavonol-4-reductase [Bacteroidia bacterium]|jgi:dihydroflavonol-4-reductase